MEGFTIWMALVDAVPVALFAGSMGVLASRFDSRLFLLGAVVSIAAGCGKVLWKAILGIWKKDIGWLNRYFLPVQGTGFALTLLSFLLNFSKIPWAGVWKRVSAFPAWVFLLLWLLGMGAMGAYKKTKFDNSPRANWTAQCLNCLVQGMLLLGLLF